MKKVALNGGRIGRLILRHCLLDPHDNIEIVTANDLVPNEDLAYLIRYDSVHVVAPSRIEAGRDYLKFGTSKLTISNEKNPANFPWKALSIDIVFEGTGLFRNRNDATKYLQAGA